MLTENAIKIIETGLGISGLSEMIASEEATEITPTKTKHFPEVDYNILVENLQSQGLTPEKYADAKKAGEEMSVKETKRTKGYEFEGKSVSDLVDYLEKKIESKSITDVTEKEKEYQKDLDQLKKQLIDKTSEVENISFKRKEDKINWLVDNEFNSLQIETPPSLKEDEIETFIKNEINKNKIYFKSQHSFDIENDLMIIKNLQGEIMKDSNLSPVKIDNAVKEFAAQNFIKYGAQGIKGRGGKDQYPGNNALADIKNVDQLTEYAKSKGVIPNTKEFDALYIEFQKNN